MGPLTHQGLGYPTRQGFKTWQMYSGFGQDICRARFFEHRPDGEVVALDRFEILGHTRDSAPRYVTFIPSLAQVARTGETMCRRMGKGLDLHVVGDCGSRDQWQPMSRLEGVNLCTLDERALKALDRPIGGHR